MTAQATMDEIFELMGTVGLKHFLSHTLGKRTVHVFVNPNTLFSLHAWQEGERVHGVFAHDTQEYLQSLVFKKRIVQNATTMLEAQRKARDFFLEFTGGENV